jgi:hypothetical protein
MNRDWNDFKALHSNIAGAREAFENACETLFRKKYPKEHVSQVSVSQGDGGIDIFIGELGQEEIIVIQCKFFLDKFEDAQKNQIRESFKTAIESDKYTLKEWILCIPRVIDINENSWWFNWKNKQITTHSKDNTFIKLINGNEIIALMRKHGVYNEIFKMEDSNRLKEIHEILCPPKKEISSISVKPNVVLFNNYNNEVEDYYAERTQDITFNETLLINNIWLSGESGKGKTALINRNLSKSCIEYIYCDLSPITIIHENDILEEIICTLEENFNLERDSKEKNLIKNIVKLLINAKKENIVIVIDELSCNDYNLLEKIATSFLSLVTHYNSKNSNTDLKFIVSTKIKPEKLIKDKSKASEYFQYICCDNWDVYLERLFDTLVNALNLELSVKDKEFILKGANKSPRILKNIIRKRITTDKELVKIIQQVQEESI